MERFIPWGERPFGKERAAQCRSFALETLLFRVAFACGPCCEAPKDIE
jgi:hypothetical protein